MLFRTLFTLSTLAIAVSAVSVPKTPFIARSPKVVKGDVYRRNQFKYGKVATRSLRAKRATTSPDCSASLMCTGNQFCDGGHCTSCPTFGSPSASGSSCDCQSGYELASVKSQDVCRCANVQNRNEADNSCATQTCSGGYSKTTNSAGQPICACSFGTSGSDGRCVSCYSGYRSTSINGLNACVCENGTSDASGACTSCNANYVLEGGICVPKCSSAANCSGTKPFCSPFTSTCASTCSVDSQCTAGQTCSMGSCVASSNAKCTTPKGTLCASGATCTYQGFCATNNNGPTGAYQGCFSDPGRHTSRALGTETQGVDYLVGNNVDIATCQNFCRAGGYKYAGVEYYNQCYCGNTNKGTTATENNCYLSCNTAKAQLCGGDSHISVYQLS